MNSIDDIIEIYETDHNLNFHEPYVNLKNLYLLVPRNSINIGNDPVIFKKIIGDPNNPYNLIENRILTIERLRYNGLFLIKHGYNPFKYLAIKTPYSIITETSGKISGVSREEIDELKKFIIDFSSFLEQSSL